jgi:hypothetical protein
VVDAAVVVVVVVPAMKIFSLTLIGFAETNKRLN